MYVCVAERFGAREGVPHPDPPFPWNRHTYLCSGWALEAVEAVQVVEAVEAGWGLAGTLEEKSGQTLTMPRCSKS